MVEYDVLGNERHKAICKLREMPKLYPNKDGGADLYAWKSALADAIGANTELFSAIRDRLIHLLGGDQPKFSELFGILRRTMMEWTPDQVIQLVLILLYMVPLDALVVGLVVAMVRNS